MAEIEMTVSECCDAIKKLKETLYTTCDRPKGNEYYVIEGALIDMCNKLKTAKLKESK